MPERETLIELINEGRDRAYALSLSGRKWSKRMTVKTIADYLISEGMIVPPCKVGATVYFTYGKEILQGYVEEITDSKKGLRIACKFENGEQRMFWRSDFGENIFLTKNEAEKGR